jgi:hypothetical protein
MTQYDVGVSCSFPSNKHRRRHRIPQRGAREMWGKSKAKAHFYNERVKKSRDFLGHIGAVLVWRRSRRVSFSAANTLHSHLHAVVVGVWVCLWRLKRSGRRKFICRNVFNSTCERPLGRYFTRKSIPQVLSCRFSALLFGVLAQRRGF